MRTHAALGALAAASFVLLSACAPMQSQSQSQSPSSCEVASVPAGAVFGLRDGLDTATYPSQIPADRTGCQRVWYGERQHPEAMQILATYYFEQGHVQRLVGQVPGGPSYDCHYREGALDSGGSRNASVCPAAARIDKLPLTRP